MYLDHWVRGVADREELGKLVQQLKEKQEKVRDNTSLGDNGPRYTSVQ